MGMQSVSLRKEDDTVMSSLGRSMGFVAPKKKWTHQQKSKDSNILFAFICFAIFLALMGVAGYIYYSQQVVENLMPGTEYMDMPYDIENPAPAQPMPMPMDAPMLMPMGPPGQHGAMHRPAHPLTRHLQ